MRSHKISGMPRKCLNRNCDGLFTRQSHLGYMLQSEIDVYIVLRCPSCADTFVVSQTISMAHEYYNKLPKNLKEATKNGSPITLGELRKFKQQLSQSDNLKNIIDSENSD